LSGNFDASDLGVGIDNVQFFANGVNTVTTGVDLVVNWIKKMENSQLSIDLSGNINKMIITHIKNKTLDQETFFGKRDQQYLLASAPKNKFNLGISYRFKKLETSVKFTRFSRVDLLDWQVSQDISDFNNSEAERTAAAQDIYNPRTTTDLHFSYHVTAAVNIQFGANNILNVYPTKQNSFTDSGGLWDATQMGTNGSFYYTKLNIKL
jgi:iron complex outermembrane receptor protein